MSGFSPRRPAGRVARYARRDHYASLREALAPIAAALEDRGWRATVICDDNGLVDRAAAHRAGLGWFGKNSLLLVPGFGLVVGAGLGGHRRAPSAHRPRGAPTSCRGLRQLLPLSDRVPHRGPGRPRGSRRPSMPGLAGAGPGSFPEQYRRALGDRIYGCDECQQVCPINRVADRRDPPPPPERRQSALGGPPRAPRALRRSPDGGARPLVHRRTRSPLPTPECTPGAGQRGGRRRPRNRAGIDPLAVGRRRDDRRARPVGGPGSWVGTTAVGRTGEPA